MILKSDEANLTLLPNLPVDPDRRNPMLRWYGPGLEGTRCKTCKHLRVKEFSRRYYKCGLRADSGGPGTDIRVNWKSCSKYKDNHDTNRHMEQSGPDRP